MSRLLAGDPSPRHEARPLFSSPAPNLRKPLVALTLSGATLLVPLALSGSGGAPGAPGAEVVLAAGTPARSPLEATGADDELLGTLVDAGVAARAESDAVSVEVQPASVPESVAPRPAARTATTGRPRLLTARAATVATVGTSPSSSQPTATTAKRAPATTAAPPPRPTTTRPPAAASPAPSSGSDAVWDRLAQCESGNTNDHDAPYYGYWQFDEATWLGLGQVGLPDDYSRAQQLVVAKRLRAISGWSPWPGCARSLGLL